VGVTKKAKRAKPVSPTWVRDTFANRVAYYYSSPKIELIDLLCKLKQEAPLIAERVAERRRLRDFSIDGSIPKDSSKTGKRVVLA
jgi:hypothetical protein